MGEGFKEVKLKGRIVNWLINLNKSRPNDRSIDKHFIKALLIAAISVDEVKKGDLNAEIVKFIKGKT